MAPSKVNKSPGYLEAIWPGQAPLGKRVWVGPPQSAWAEAVGVATDVDQRGRLVPMHELRLDVYFPLFRTS
jgi:hypothetical protein